MNLVVKSVVKITLKVDIAHSVRNSFVKNANIQVIYQKDLIFIHDSF